MNMDPISIRNDLRAFLNSKDVSLAEIERSTRLNRSWLSKFRRGEILNPRVDQLAELYRYQQAMSRAA